VEPHEYATLYAFETNYWWFRVLHGILLDQVSSLNLAADSAVLEAGCGTGGFLRTLQGRGAQACGFDFSHDAAHYWPARGIMRVAVASINEIPFAGETFEIVTSIDVLESDAVNLSGACSEIIRVLKPGGYAIVTIPAYRWMLTEGHHAAVHASRRFSRASASALWDGLPARIVRMTHLFAAVFPMTALYRLVLRARPPSRDVVPRSELKPIPEWLNCALIGVCSVERRMLRHIDMPFGSTLLMVVQKQ
jgi:SAM-dependent methyltransferase